MQDAILLQYISYTMTKEKEHKVTPFCPSCTRPSGMPSGRMLCLLSALRFSLSSCGGRWMHATWRENSTSGTQYTAKRVANATTRGRPGCRGREEATAKFHQIFAEKSQNSSKNAKKWQISSKFWMGFRWNFEIWAVQKYENLVDLEKPEKMSIWLLS